mmetsp:Transcript_42134/g.127830  ORF Transcript_42134/g.127830 Transcript_42134/m.127830 type:complete len:107 (-) Transcript_42134:3-323(-)
MTGWATLPCAVGGALVWAFVPESARFLALRGRYGEAAKAANRLADGMGYRGPAMEADEVRYHFEKEALAFKPPPPEASADAQPDAERPAARERGGRGGSGGVSGRS